MQYIESQPLKHGAQVMTRFLVILDPDACAKYAEWSETYHTF